MDCGAASWEDILVKQLWRSMKYEEVRLKACANGREAGIGIGQRRIPQPPAASPGDGQPATDGHAAPWLERDRGGGRSCGYAASLRQRKRDAQYPQWKRKNGGKRVKRFSKRKRKDRADIATYPVPLIGITLRLNVPASTVLDLSTTPISA
jgi:hypothetical protein